MRIHDAYARVTPYEIALPGRAFAEERFGLIREEAARRGVDVWDPGAFAMLGQAGRAMGDIRDEDENPANFVRYGAILFHAFHFWNAGEALYLLSAGAARQLAGSGRPSSGAGRGMTGGVDDGPAGIAAPAQAGYLQLPRHLFWASSGDGDPAEPLDGFFWVLTPGDLLHLLAASGMRADRPGFGVTPVPAMRREEAGRWAEATVRERGVDFESTLPGGEDVCSIETLGELVKLAGRLFRQLEEGILRVGAPERSGGTGTRAPNRAMETDAPNPAPPLASTLPYRVVTTAERR